MCSKALRAVQISCASIWCLLSAGIIFGFAAFKYILLGEDIYGEYCSIDSTEPCTEQDLKLNFIFALAAGITNIAALPVGWTLDHFGPWVTGIIGSFWMALGATMYIWAGAFSHILDPYLTGYSMFAIGGPYVFISSFHLANSFPEKSGFILSLITGTFDCSSAVFLFFKVCYQRKNWSLSRLFSIYMIVPLFIFFSQLTVMPYGSYKTQGTTDKASVEPLDENGRLLEAPSSTEILPGDEEHRSLLNEGELPGSSGSRRKSVVGLSIESGLTQGTGGTFGVLHNQSVTEQICNPLFYLMLIFTMICMLRINYYVATIRSQELYLLKDSELALRLNSIFDVLLPVGGVIAIPLTGLILHHMGTFDVLLTLFITSMTVGILGLIPNSFSLQLIHIVILVIYRPFLYTIVCDYVSKVFGFDTFGTIYGLLISVSGMFTMVQSVLDRVTHTTFDMNPIPVNSILVVVTAVSGVALLWDFCHRRDIRSLNENRIGGEDN